MKYCQESEGSWRPSPHLELVAGEGRFTGSIGLRVRLCSGISEIANSRLRSFGKFGMLGRVAFEEPRCD